MYFVNKQLTYFIEKLSSFGFLKQFSIVWVKQTFSEILSKIERGVFEIIEWKHQLFVYKNCPIDKKKCLFDFDETLWDCSTHFRQKNHKAFLYSLYLHFYELLTTKKDFS